MPLACTLDTPTSDVDRKPDEASAWVVKENECLLQFKTAAQQ